MSVRTLYHYVVEKRELDTTTSIDGLCITDTPIETMEQYRDFKLLVSEAMNPREASKWVVASLSILQTYEEGQHKVL